jgi:hypothetical protein
LELAESTLALRVWAAAQPQVEDMTPFDSPSRILCRFYQMTFLKRSLFRGMAQSAIDKIPPGPQLDELTAEKVFGWKNVHRHKGSRSRTNYGRFSTIRTVIFLLAGKLDFSKLNPHVANRPI